MSGFSVNCTTKLKKINVVQRLEIQRSLVATVIGFFQIPPLFVWHQLYFACKFIKRPLIRHFTLPYHIDAPACSL